MNDQTNQPSDPAPWEAAFRQWGSRPQPQLRPFFYTRLQVRLHKSVTATTWLPIWLRRPAYAYVGLLLLLLLNIGAALRLARGSASPTDAETPTIMTLQDQYPTDDYTLAYE